MTFKSLNPEIPNVAGVERRRGKRGRLMLLLLPSSKQQLSPSWAPGPRHLTRHHEVPLQANQDEIHLWTVDGEAVQ